MVVIWIKRHVDLLSFPSWQLHLWPRGQDNLTTPFFHLPWEWTSTCTETLGLSHHFLKPTSPGKIPRKAISNSDSNSSESCQIRESILWELRQCWLSPDTSRVLACLAALLNREGLSVVLPYVVYSWPLTIVGLNCLDPFICRLFSTHPCSSTDPCSSNLCCSRVKSMLRNPCMQRADSGYTWIFDCVWGQHP